MLLDFVLFGDPVVNGLGILDGLGGNLFREADDRRHGLADEVLDEVEVFDQGFPVDFDLETVVDHLHRDILRVFDAGSNLLRDFLPGLSGVLELIDDELESLLGPVEPDLEGVHLEPDELRDEIIGDFPDNSCFQDEVVGLVEDELGVVGVQGHIAQSESLGNDFSDDEGIEFSGLAEESNEAGFRLGLLDGDDGRGRGLLHLQLVDQVVEAVLHLVEDSLGEGVDPGLEGPDVGDPAAQPVGGIGHGLVTVTHHSVQGLVQFVNGLVLEIRQVGLYFLVEALDGAVRLGVVDCFDGY